MSSRISRRDFLRISGMAAAGIATASTGLMPAAASTKKQATTISQWYHQYGEAGTQEAAMRYAAQYTEVNPDVVVDMVWVPGDYKAKCAASLLTPEGPDVFEWDPNPTLAMVEAEQIAPLDELFEGVLEDFAPQNIALNTIGEHIYGIKMIDDPRFIYYRPSLLEEAGFEPPASMDDVIAIAAHFASNRRTKGIFLGNDAGIDALYITSLWAAGENIIEGEEITFDNERTVAAYAKVKELYDSGGVLQGFPTDWWDPTAFIEGNAAMQWCGLWAMPQIIEALGEDFDIIPWPALDDMGVPATFWGGWSTHVNAKGANIEAAKAFAKWLWIDAVDNQIDWSLSYGFHVPPRLSTAAAAEPLQEGKPMKAAEIMGLYGRVMPPTWSEAMHTILKTALGEICQNNADVASTVSAAATECQAELDALLS